jgi:hypothetical protein
LEVLVLFLSQECKGSTNNNLDGRRVKQPDSLASWSAVAQWFMADHERSQRIPKATPEPSLGFTATMTQIMQEQADVIKHMTGKKKHP